MESLRAEFMEKSAEALQLHSAGRGARGAGHGMTQGGRHSARVLAWAFGALIGVSAALSATSVAALAAPSASPGPTAPSSGCALPAGRTGVFTLKTTDGNHRSRSYLIQVPADYTPSRAYPLYFVFHGGGGNSRQSYGWGLQNAPGAAANGIFIFPQGIEFQRYGVGWDDSKNSYDLPFFDNMLNETGAAYCIDSAHVFVAGFSWGGDFVIALACHRGDKIRAVVANSTDDEYKDTADFMTYRGFPCGTRRPPSVRFSHAIGGDQMYPPPDFATTSQLLQYLNGCSGKATQVTSSSAVMSCVSHEACETGYVECSFDTRIGHGLPPNWAEDTWKYFSQF